MLSQQERNSCSSKKPQIVQEPKTPITNTYLQLYDGQSCSLTLQRKVAIYQLLLLVLLLSLILLAGAIGINYVINSTDHYGQVANCQSQEMQFIRFYKCVCVKCAPGFQFSPSDFGCAPI